ncbi:MAG TPA: OsmC family protein [Bacteroidales bacterium]|nr:OsmC family protein [Bacteroidales bacterium]HPS17427.1 OsmC family protein [Bacteroidales bacterium]
MKIEVTFEGNKKVNANINGHIVKTDQPVTGGGEGTAPTPFELFLASLATCAGIYVKGFCDQRGISAENIHLFQDMEYDPATQMVKKINIDIQVPADFPEKYKEALINVASLCKVKKHIQQPPEFSVFTSVK